jgi:hypothetical protein
MTRVALLPIACWLAAQVPLPAQSPAAAKPKPAKTTSAPRKTPPAKASPQSEVLNNDAIIKMVSAGIDEQTILAKISASKTTDFRLGTDDLIRLKQAKVPDAVIRAMLTPGAAPASPAPAAATSLVKDPGPAVPPPIPADLQQVVIRQGATITPLVDKPQTVTFIKSEAGSVGSAITNIVLSDVGLQLITMGMSSQMMMWNPYLGDTIQKAASLGKGMLLNRGSDTKGFEIETLSGMTAETTLKEGRAELFIPVRHFLPSADLDPSTIEPALLRLTPREKEGTRLLSGRKVLLKQTKKGRFDMKPTTDRIESELEQTVIPVQVERMPDGVVKVTPQEDLKRGEYALVFRRKDPSGAYTANVPLKPSTAAKSASEAAAADSAAEAMGIPAETWAQLTPEQKQMMQQQMQMQQGMQGQSRGGLFGRRRSPPPAPAQPASGDVAGFLAWEFRVM